LLFSNGPAKISLTQGVLLLEDGGERRVVVSTLGRVSTG
jgi:hypothetical protein